MFRFLCRYFFVLPPNTPAKNNAPTPKPNPAVAPTPVATFRLLVCFNCVSCENKKNVFRTRDSNYSINVQRCKTT